MKRFLITLTLALATLSLGAQVAEYNNRYQKLVERVGVSGPGVESVLDKWAQVDSSDLRYLQARFLYYYDKSRSDATYSTTNPRYLGQEPMFSLKDTSNHTTVYYYLVDEFDDELFGKALHYLDRAITLNPFQMDLRVTKLNSLFLYEKESPDMTEACLLNLIEENKVKEPKWTYEGSRIDQEDFKGMIQEYCVNLFNVGSDRSLEAFLNVTEKMLSYDKKNLDFMANVGSYYMKKKDYKKALKQYDKVLKKDPEHYSALTNARTIARVLKDPKLIAKYGE